jgi:hypothetical protein
VNPNYMGMPRRDGSQRAVLHLGKGACFLVVAETSSARKMTVRSELTVRELSVPQFAPHPAIMCSRN